MAKKMNLEELDDLFLKNKDFELTEEQYENRVGKSLPKSKQGITGKYAPLRRKADECGFKISVEERAVIQRVVVFTRGGNHE